jgi:hypothetical protein
VHDPADLLAVRSRPDSELVIRSRHTELAEEHGRQVVVVVLPGMHEHLFVPLAQRS